MENFPLWFFLFLIMVGALFCTKIVYVITVGFTLRKTDGAVFVGTPRNLIKDALEVIPVKSGMKIIDLGCGDGRILRYVTKKYNVQAIGYEINPMAYMLARIFCLGKKQIRVINKNFWEEDFSNADVIFCYLFPDVMAKLSKKLRNELRPGAWVVSFNFSIPGLKPKEIINRGPLDSKDPIFIYVL